MTTRVLKYLVLIAFLLLIVAISSFWFSQPSFREGDVILEIDGPTQAASGEEVIYKLKYINKTRSILYDLDFSFSYPEGSTILIDGKVYENHAKNFKIEELTPGNGGEKEFQMFLVGERGSVKITKATLSFKAGNITSSFEKTKLLSTTIVSTPVSLTLSAPPTIAPGDPIQYVLDYRNESDEDISDLILDFDYPDDFSSKNFDPQPESGNNLWLIKLLKKGSGGRISVDGVLSGSEGDNRIVSAKLKRKIGDQYIDYQKISAATVISNPILGIEVLANNSSDYTASLGDKLNYRIKYRNNSNFDLSGMNLEVRLEGDMFELSKLDTRGGFFDSTSKVIRWDFGANPDFANLSANAKGQIDFDIAIKSIFPSTSVTSRDRFVKVTAKLNAPNVNGEFERDETSVSASLITRIWAQPTFNQSVYYNDSDFGSSGPLPLVAGEETLLTVHWQLANPGNETENVKIIAKLPLGVEWTNMVKTIDDKPAPLFNPDTSEVTWLLSKLPYGTGSYTPKYETSFQIKVKPNDSQKGNTISILENVQFTGTDSFTKQGIIINGNNLSSDELADRPHEGSVQ